MAKRVFRHVVPSVFVDPTPDIVSPGHRPLFLPGLLKEAGLQVNRSRANECDVAHLCFKTWIENLESGVLDALTETQVEQDFYKLLMGSLGYRTKSDLATGQSWNMQPKCRETGADTADATLGPFHWDEERREIIGQPIAVVEVKGAAKDLDRRPGKGRSPVQQAWDYLNGSETAQWAIVSNFREFRLYSRLRPSRYAHRVIVTDLKDRESFAAFYAVFHADGLLGSTPIALNAADLLKQTGARQDKVGEELYRFYSERRAKLIGAIKAQRDVNTDEAIRASQRLLDRILFIAFAQARGLLSDPQVLKKTAEVAVPGLTHWMAFQLLFRAIDTGDELHHVPRYNGNLFKRDPILDDPLFELDSSWANCFKTFGQYDYRDEVTVDVLGRISERSITDIEELKSTSLDEHEADLARRAAKAVRRKTGVYYTVAFVVEYLVSAALNPLLDRFRDALIEESGFTDGLPDLAPAAFTRAMLVRLDALTICDPACGSGAFLTEAYHWFESHRCDLLRDLQLVEPDAPECRDGWGMPGNLDDWRARSAHLILKNNIFGVDLSRESVEIAQLSLWIRTARRGQLLTDLSTNVVCGNSVVDSPDFDPARAFDWRASFPAVFERGGFDAVVGNPPYVRQERLTAFKPHWGQAFPEVFDPIADLYVYFFGRSLEVLKPGGRLAFICANGFARAAFGAKLRASIQVRATLERFFDLGDTQVFKDAKDVTPVLIVIENRPPTEGDHVQSLRIRRSDDVTQVAKLALEQSIYIPLSRLSSDAWQFEDEAVFKLREKLLAGHQSLLDYVKRRILLGIKTGLNEAFVIDDEQKQAIESKCPSARGVLRPLKGGEDLRRWYQEESGRWLIYLPNGVTRASCGATEEASGWDWLRATYPAIADHLALHEAKARVRDDQGQFWWELRACDYYDVFDRPKIVYPDIAKATRFSTERGGSFLGNTTYLIPVDDDYLLAVLNSSVTWFVLSGISIPFGERAGEYRYRMFTQYVGRVPVPACEPPTREEIGVLARQASEWGRARHVLTENVLERLVDGFNRSLVAPKTSIKLRKWPTLSFVELGAELKKSFLLGRNPWERPLVADEWSAYMKDRYAEHADLSHRIAQAEDRIDRLVFRLFDLDPGEVQRLRQGQF